MIEDFDLIVASFTSQYGLRISDIKQMRWSEFRSLLVGISPDTILGRIVAIRAENNKEILKNFTADQHRIRNEWRAKHARGMNKKDAKAAIADYEKIFLEMVGVKIAEN